MIWAQLASQLGQYHPELLFRPGVIPARRHLPGNAYPRRERVRVIRAQRVLLIYQSPLVQLNGLV